MLQHLANQSYGGELELQKNGPVLLGNWRSCPACCLKEDFSEMLTLSHTHSAGKTTSSFQRGQFCRCWFCCSRAVPGPLLCSAVWQVHSFSFLLHIVQGLSHCYSLCPGPCLQPALPSRDCLEAGWIDRLVSPLQVSVRVVYTKQLWPRSKEALLFVFYWT